MPEAWSERIDLFEAAQWSQYARHPLRENRQVHIGFRTSGGRGEYEVVGGHAGQSAAGLEGWTFQFRWPDGIVRATDLWLDPGESGKPRLRSLAKRPFQIGRIVAGFLLLPEPRREMRSVASTLPVIRSKDYVVMKVGFGPETEFASPPENVTAEPNYVEAVNAAHSEFVHVGRRWARIQAVVQNRASLPTPITSALTSYSDFIASGAAADGKLLGLGASLRSAVAAADPSYGQEDDPLPALERMLGVAPAVDPELPPPDELGDDEGEVKARSAGMYRLARVRSASARRFSVDVREAYGHRCAFCGARLGGVAQVPSGIDAAHILAWSNYDLDVVSNGIALCKTHHWAFDAALMVPVISGGDHLVRFTSLASEFEPETLDILGTDGQIIPDERLPGDTTLRPNPKYLKRLYDDLLITF